MNWLQKISQYSIEDILISVVNGRLSAESAFAKLSKVSTSADCCDHITSLFQSYPAATRPLSALSRMFQCNSLLSNQPAGGQLNQNQLNQNQQTDNIDNESQPTDMPTVEVN